MSRLWKTHTQKTQESGCCPDFFWFDEVADPGVGRTLRPLPGIVQKLPTTAAFL
jgi:hypothetical protein